MCRRRASRSRDSPAPNRTRTADGKAVQVYQITPATPNAYFMPGADPGEGYTATNCQIFGSTTAPTPPTATKHGFVTDYAYTLGWETKEAGWGILPGTVANDIMGCFTPDDAAGDLRAGQGFRGMRPLVRLGADGDAAQPRVRAVRHQPGPHGRQDEDLHRALDLRLADEGRGRLEGSTATTQPPLTQQTFPDLATAPEANFGEFTDFQADAAAGTLPGFTFLEPSWSATGNSQHPNYDVALGEQLIHDVYTALRNGPGWNQTLFVLTYDEHGGLYDHVPPPSNAPRRTTRRASTASTSTASACECRRCWSRR